MYIHIEVLVGKCGCYSSDFQDMLYMASRKQCYVSPLENNAMSLSKILIVSPLYMTVTVLPMVYGAVAIASDCANLKKIYRRRASLFLSLTLTLLLFCCSIYGVKTNK